MLIGHHKQWQYLQGLAKSGHLPHAFLFWGPAQVGKRTVALELVKTLNRQVARSDRDIEKNQYPDLIMVEPAKGEIQISQIRDLIWKLSLRPYRAVFKTAIIDRAHLMNREAQSCLLKTLEEPRGRALLILVSEYPEALLGTVLSRVEKLAFFPVPAREIEKVLPAGQGDSREILFFAAGRPGRAVSFLQEPQKLKEWKRAFQEISQLPSLSYVQRFSRAHNLSNAPERLNETLELWLEYFRGKLKEDGAAPAAAGAAALLKITKTVKAIERTLFLISSTNVNVRLALENLLLEI